MRTASRSERIEHVPVRLRQTTTSFAAAQPLPAKRVEDARKRADAGERSPRSCAAGEGDSQHAERLERRDTQAPIGWRVALVLGTEQAESPPHPLASKTMRATSPR